MSTDLSSDPLGVSAATEPLPSPVEQPEVERSSSQSERPDLRSSVNVLKGKERSTLRSRSAERGSSSPSMRSGKLRDITLDLNVGPSASLPSHDYAQILASHMETGGNSAQLDRSMSQGVAPDLGATTPGYEETDPLLLRSKVVNEQEIRRRVSGKGKRAEREVAKFYETQNSHIHNLLKPMSKHASEDAEDREGAALKVRIAVYASIGANFVLAGLQVYAAVSSLSLSLFATMADSVFDPVSTNGVRVPFGHALTRHLNCQVCKPGAQLASQEIYKGRRAQVADRWITL